MQFVCAPEHAALKQSDRFSYHLKGLVEDKHSSTRPFKFYKKANMIPSLRLEFVFWNFIYSLSSLIYSKLSLLHLLWLVSYMLLAIKNCIEELPDLYLI